VLGVAPTPELPPSHPGVRLPTDQVLGEGPRKRLQKFGIHLTWTMSYLPEVLGTPSDAANQ
jgi:hypothetical protein